MRRMHHTMGPDYGSSEDEEYYRSRTTNRSRAASRQRSHSRNKAHNDAYEPPKQPRFFDVSEILSLSRTASPVTASHDSQVANSFSSPAVKKLPPLKQASEEDIQKAESMAMLEVRSHLRDVTTYIARLVYRNSFGSQWTLVSCGPHHAAWLRSLR